VDRVDLLHAELADLLAPEELASARTGSTRTAWATSAGAAATGTIPRWTVWAIPGGTLWTIPCRTVSRRAVAGRTLGCGALRRARCCCYCAGLISHGFLLLSSRPAFFVSGRRDRPCSMLLCANRTGCVMCRRVAGATYKRTWL
jgi:hypothetical protein